MSPNPPDPARVRDAFIAAHLTLLISLPEWDIFRLQMEETIFRHIEGLCTVSHDHRYEQGKIQGMREMMLLAETLIARAKR